jgi:ankyrin repeat protein
MNLARLLSLLLMVMFIGSCERKLTESTELIEPIGPMKPTETTKSIHQAVADDDIGQVQLHISSGTDLDARDETLQTPLHYAALRGHRNVAELLIANGADVNAEDNEGITPLHRATEKHHTDVAELLLAKGADVNAKTTDKEETPLIWAAYYGYNDVAELLIANGADVNAEDNEGITPLHRATEKHHMDVAELLLAKGADVNAKTTDKEETPLIWAAYYGYNDVAELLINKGADINVKDQLGRTPMAVAKEKGRDEVLELLRKHGAEVSALRSISHVLSDKPYVILERGDIRAVIVNNEPVGDEVLPGHRGGYSGVASLTHGTRDKNLFVPLYAGLNFEHIHDGTIMPRDILFEPRRAPLETRQVDECTVELYQKPTPHWQLESWLRYQLLEDGAIEMTLECIPYARSFKNDYIGLFFASYIDQPESLDIHFLGRPADENDTEPQWIRGVTPAHGELSTHLALDDTRNFAHDADFPLTLVFNTSNYHYSEPWYYGVSHGMAFVFMFRPSDHVRFSQSPSGGGKRNPAWDFQWFIPQYEVGQRYRFVMRAMYLPFESGEQIIQATAPHRAALHQR